VFERRIEEFLRGIERGEKRLKCSTAERKAEKYGSRHRKWSQKIECRCKCIKVW
jgi:hypothetical protein